MMIWARLLPILAVGLAVATCSEPADQAAGPEPAKLETLTLGITPALGPAASQRLYEPLATYLATEIEVAAAVRVSDSYRDLTRLVAAGEVQIAVLSPLGYVSAKRKMPGLKLLAIPIVEGQASYDAYIVSPAKSGIKTIEDLRGKTFGFIDRGSTSGYLYPLAYLRGLGHEPDEFFGAIRFAGDHAKLVEMLRSGELDGGATFTRDPSLRILAKTGRIPAEAFCASPSLDPKLVARLRELLLNCDRSGIGKLFLAQSYMQAFASAEDDYYDEVRRALRLVEATPR